VSFQDANVALGPDYYHGMGLPLRSSHIGLFRTQALRDIGGYYSGFRIGYDTLIVHLLLMTGRLSYLDEPLYHRTRRGDSLSHSPFTGMASPTRRQVTEQLASIYGTAFGWYMEYLAGHMEAEQLCSSIRQLCNSQMTQQDRQDLLAESDRLTALLRECHML